MQKHRIVLLSLAFIAAFGFLTLGAMAQDPRDACDPGYYWDEYQAKCMLVQSLVYTGDNDNDDDDED